MESINGLGTRLRDSNNEESDDTGDPNYWFYLYEAATVLVTSNMDGRRKQIIEKGFLELFK